MIEFWKGKKADDERKKVQEKAQKLISKLLKETKSSGITLSFINEITIGELLASANGKLSETSIIDTLVKMKNEGKESIEDFENIYSESLKNLRKKKPTIWDFYIPFHFPFNKRKIHILSKKFEIISSKYIHRKINAKKLPKLKGEEIHMNLYQFPVKYLCISVAGANKIEAWNEVAQAFDLLRGILELSTKLGRINLIMPFGQRQVSNFIHPEMIIVKENISDEYDYLKFIVEKRTTAPHINLSENNLKNFKVLIKKFENDLDEKTTESLLADALRLYSQAMDAMNHHNCFVGFWQLLECITLSENLRGNTDKVIDRIQYHVNNLLPTNIDLSFTLRLIKYKRHYIVHRGIINIVEERDINILKLLSERAINWLLDNLKYYPTTLHLESFYSLKSENNKRKNAMRDVLKQLDKKLHK